MNLVKWNNRKPVIDLRKWNDDHTRMGKGFSLTKEEVDGLREMLNSLVENEEE